MAVLSIKRYCIKKAVQSHGFGIKKDVVMV